MKTVYSAANISLVSIFQNMLKERGIKCWIKNEALLTGIGEIPPIETWPQLCVEDDDYLEAKRIVDEALATKDISSPWKCDSCGEIIEGQFGQCWNCGKDRPEMNNASASRRTTDVNISSEEIPDQIESEEHKQLKSIRGLRIFLLIMSGFIILLANLPSKPGQSDMKKGLLSFAILLLLALLFTFLPKRSKKRN
jgi:hypothetical protein